MKYTIVYRPCYVCQRKNIKFSLKYWNDSWIISSFVAKQNTPGNSTYIFVEFLNNFPFFTRIFRTKIGLNMYGQVKRKLFTCVDVHCGGEPARVLIAGKYRTQANRPRSVYFMFTFLLVVYSRSRSIQEVGLYKYPLLAGQSASR